MNEKYTYIIGNWKMNKTIAEARSFVSALAVTHLPDSTYAGLAVPYTMIAAAAEAARGSSILIGAQDVSAQVSGAYTSEISCSLAIDAGAAFSLIGHSERRQYHKETDAIVNNKLKTLLATHLQAVVCIGESAEERQQNRTEVVLKQQILNALQGVTAEQFHKIALAYEPLWAIGTGLSATPEQAQSVHHFCRTVVASKWGDVRANKLLILYGGSVKADNAKELLLKPDIDGLLVGGASLEIEEFNKILHSKSENIAS